MWSFKSKPKRDLSVLFDRHEGCRTCKRRIGEWPCKLIAVRGVPTIPDVPLPPDLTARD